MKFNYRYTLLYYVYKPTVYVVSCLDKFKMIVKFWHISVKK